MLRTGREPGSYLVPDAGRHLGSLLELLEECGSPLGIALHVHGDDQILDEIRRARRATPALSAERS